MHILEDDDLELDNTFLNQEELLSFLSQHVITLVNTQARTVKSEIDSLKDNIKSLGGNLSNKRKILVSLESEVSRQKALKRVLKLISSLQREGVLTGQNKIKISNLLKDIDVKDFSTLRKLEEALVAYLPA